MEAPEGPVAAVAAIANNAAQAANDFFNNPLSAIQPNVFQNIIPDVKPAVEYIFKAKLYDNIEEKWKIPRYIEKFFDDLKKSKALIAGGFVLAAVHIAPHIKTIKEIEADADLTPEQKASEINDLQVKINSILKRVNDADIYVNISKFRYLFERAFDEEVGGYFQNPNGSYVKYRSSIYCQSFLRRNGIKAVHRYKYPNLPGRGNGFNFDVMAIREKHTPLQVVNNFDLTFCQVWFDGESCYATYPDHVLKKEGWVQKDYLPLLYRGNHFIKDRIRKYLIRGFKILENPALTPELAKEILTQSSKAIVRIYPEQCDSVTKPTKRYEDSDFLRKWTIRMILDYIALLTVFPEKPDISYFKPLLIQFRNSRYSTSHTIPDIIGIKTRQRFYYEGNFEGINPEDGYDTDDFDTPDLKGLKDLGLNLTEGDLVQTGIVHATATEDDKTLIFYRITNALLYHLYKESKDEYHDDLTAELGETLVDIEGGFTDYAPALKLAYKNYMTVLRSLCIRKTDQDLYFASEGDEVFDFHAHKLDKAISAENLEGYLMQFIKEADHSAVPCYLHTPSEPANSCDEKITFNDIRYIVSPAFYARYTAPPLIKTGLNQSVASFNITLENTKSEDPAGYGDIFHYTMCPFCLQLETRDDGCAYMTHANPQRLTGEAAPYCLPQFVVPEIRQKYMDAGLAIMGEQGLAGVPPHMEFCIECGRPCFNHEHFDFSDPPRLIPSHNPGICSGGGRKELFARILAVRGVYRDAGITDPKTERLTAALAADSAALSDDLMARAQVIFDMPESERIWGNADIPSRKMYNDPAYSAPDNNNSNAGSENRFNAVENEEKVAEDEAPAAGGGKHKKSKGYKLTRKLGKQSHKKSKATKRR